MRISTAISRQSVSLAVACISLALGGSAALAADANVAEPKPYEWSANLISFDDATHTAVLQAPVASHVKLEGLDEFEDGDRLILTWSGRNWASGIRALNRDPELTPETLSLPVEFVAADTDGRYVSFRIPVPASAIEAISGFEPGTYVTGTSPRMATEWDKGVHSLRHYNDVG